MMVSPSDVAGNASYDVPFCPDGCSCRGSPPPYDWIIAGLIIFVVSIVMVSWP